MSDFLQPHGLQYPQLPCPSPTPGAYSNSCPLSWWCHPTISPLSPLLLPPSIYPSIRVFSNKSVLHIRWPTYWSFSFSISPSNEYLCLTSSPEQELLVPLLWNVQKHRKLIELLPNSTKNVIPVLNHYSPVYSDFCTPQTLLPTQSTYFSFNLVF